MEEPLLPPTPTHMSPGVNLRFEGELIPNLFTLQQRIQEKCRRENINYEGRYMGKSWGLFYFRKEPILTLGPDWLLFTITWTIFLTVGLLISFILITDETLKIITICVTIFESFIYGYTGLRNPGISTAIDPCNETLNNFKEYPEYCKLCGLLRDRTTIHCTDCNVCIKGFDHHCPWTGKCIGAGNVYGFQIFICATFLYILYLTIVIFVEIAINNF